jgi:glutathione S-transferase
MKLYDREGVPNAARIRIVLAEKGLENQVEFISVDLIGAEQKQDAFLTMNPIGKIPVLELDDGLLISESTAITHYLDTLDGNPTLTGRSPREAALIHMMQRRVEMLLLEPIDDYFHYGTPGLGTALAPWRMPDWPHRKEWGERRGALARRGLTYFDDLLAKQPSLATSAFSMADITLFASLLFAEAVGLYDATDFPALADWRAKIEALPAVKNRSGQTLRAEDIARMSG